MAAFEPHIVESCRSLTSSSDSYIRSSLAAQRLAKADARESRVNVRVQAKANRVLELKTNFSTKDFKS